jgi:hypothetical protein
MFLHTRNAYRLEIDAPEVSEPRRVEFTAPSVATALEVAKQYCVGRRAVFYENDRWLGCINRDPLHGFWEVC